MWPIVYILVLQKKPHIKLVFIVYDGTLFNVITIFFFKLGHMIILNVKITEELQDDNSHATKKFINRTCP